MTDQINDGGSAFPVAYSNEADGPTVMPTTGMSLRDYFAAKAIGSLVRTVQKGGKSGPDAHEDDFTWVARRAYMLADAMIKARSHD